MLRPYQSDVVSEALHAIDRGQPTLVVMPTGAGKTVVAQELMSHFGTGLFVVHRREIVQQTRRRFCDAGLHAGEVIADRPIDAAAPYQIASVQTMMSRSITVSQDIVIVDEAHRAVTESYFQAVSQAPRLIGLTATPQRGDGVGLGSVFKEMVVGPSIDELVQMGHLVACDVVGPSGKRSKLSDTPWDAWRRYANGRPGFLFCGTVEESQEAAVELCGRGIRAVHVDGATDSDERDDVVQRFRDGEVDVLSSVMVFTEGIDLPRAEVCMLARGVGSAGTFLQCVGRVMRPYPGKHRCLLVDLAGSVHQHGMPGEAREWTLEGSGLRKTERLSVRQCGRCQRVFRPFRQCPACGWSAPLPKRKIEREELQKLNVKRDSYAKQCSYYRDLVRTARMRGYRPGWVGMRFKARYGFWPNWRMAEG